MSASPSTLRRGDPQASPLRHAPNVLVDEAYEAQVRNQKPNNTSRIGVHASEENREQDCRRRVMSPVVPPHISRFPQKAPLLPPTLQTEPPQRELPHAIGARSANSSRATFGTASSAPGQSGPGVSARTGLEHPSFLVTGVLLGVWVAERHLASIALAQRSFAGSSTGADESCRHIGLGIRQNSGFQDVDWLCDTCVCVCL